jgi:hypothetical protein
MEFFNDSHLLDKPSFKHGAFSHILIWGLDRYGVAFLIQGKKDIRHTAAAYPLKRPIGAKAWQIIAGES